MKCKRMDLSDSDSNNPYENMTTEEIIIAECMDDSVEQYYYDVILGRNKKARPNNGRQKEKEQENQRLVVKSSIPTKQPPLVSHSHSHFIDSDAQVKSDGPEEELGRSLWTFLHTLVAKYPDKPSRQQKEDAKELMAILSRMYPCKECADHFKEIIRENPVQVGSHEEFSQWLRYTHDRVDRSITTKVRQV